MKPSGGNLVLYIGIVRYLGKKGGNICDCRLWYTVFA